MQKTNTLITKIPLELQNDRNIPRMSNIPLDLKNDQNTLGVIKKKKKKKNSLQSLNDKNTPTNHI